MMKMKNRFWIKISACLVAQVFFFTQIVSSWAEVLPPSASEDRSASNLVETHHLRTKPLAVTDGGVQQFRREFVVKDGGSRSLKVGELELKAETIPDLLAMQIERYGDRTSLLVPAAEGYQEISFREVGHQATQIAKAMVAHGVRQEAKVGFLSPNRPDFGISTHSVLKLGGTVVPMAFRERPAILEHMVSNSDTTFLVAAAPFLQTARDLKAKNPAIQAIFVLDDVPGLREDEVSLATWKEEMPVTLPEVEISPDDVALILYTSGSTKLPKGVPLTHKNLLYNMEASRLAWEKSFTDEEMTLGWLPFFHVMGLPHEFWKNLYVGARYAFPRLKPGPPTPDQLIQALRNTKANVLYTAPYMLEGFKAMAEGEVWEVFLGGQRIVMKFTKDPSVLETLRGLKFIMSGGVALTRELGEYFQRNGVNVIQGEGMSDVGGAIFLSDPEEKDPHTLKLIPGMNAKFVPVEGLDAEELVLAESPTTTAEYLENPEETAAALREDGFHTGDLFREVRPGRYVFVGRTDDVDKTSKAEKINKLGIERDLEKSPVIQRAAVVVSQRPRPAVIIKPDYEALRGKQWAEIENAIWEAVQGVNVELPKFSQIRRDHVIILAPDEGLPLSPKQSLIRPQVEKMYAGRLETVYTRDARSLEARERRAARHARTMRRTRGLRDLVKKTTHRNFVFSLVEDARNTQRVIVTGQDLNVARVTAVARRDVPVALTRSPKVRAKVDRSVTWLAEAIDRGADIYGATTGFGGSADVRTRKTEALQRELIRFMSSGVGPALPDEDVRGSMLIRGNANIKGYSGLRWDILENLVTLLNMGITPVVPTRGSITASGDLAPLAHIIGLLLGMDHAQARYQGKVISAREALQIAGIEPVVLGPKEGLAFINGTSVSNAVSATTLYDANILALLAQATTALSNEALLGTNQGYDPLVQEVKGHRGQIEVGANLLHLLEGSGLARDERDGKETIPEGYSRQDRYSIRTAPQWLGPLIEVLLDATERITTEMNAVSDNPLIDTEGGRALHTGNFQGTPVAISMENARLALSLINAIVDAHFKKMVNKAYNNALPANLAGTSPNLDFGMKGNDLAMTALRSELEHLAGPVMTHMHSAELDNQDVNSLGLISARRTRDVVELLQTSLASLLYAAVQAIDLRHIELAYREATKQAISNTVELTLPEIVANSKEIAPLMTAHLVRKAQSIPPFTYVFTSDQEYLLLDHEMASGISEVLRAAPEAVREGVTVQFVDNTQILAAYYKHFMATLAGQLDHLLPPAKERALQEGAAHLLGNTRPLYEFVRRDLGVRFNLADEASGPVVDRITEAIQDGRIIDPLLEAFEPTPTVAEWRAAEATERSAKAGDATAADGASHVADVAPLRPIQKIAVIGGGQMGAAFAMTAALNGLTVTVRDVDEAALGRAKARVEEGITGALKRRKLDEAGAAALRERITYTTELREAVEGADVVFEAVFEDPDVKRILFAELNSLLEPDVVLLSNTSSISVDELSPAREAHPEMVGGMHLFDPVWSQRVVEVVEREGADPRVVAQTLALARLLGKEPVVVKNRPAFVYNRLFIPLFNEMLRLYDEGFSPEAIDTVAEGLFGPGARLFWYGAGNNPNRSKTLLKTHYAATSQLQRQFKDDFYTPPSVLSRNLERIERREALWEIHEGTAVHRSDFQKIEERLLGAVFAMAGQLIDEGIVVGEQPHRTIDYGTSMLFGWRQGPFEMMNERGMAASLQLVQKLQERYPSLVIPESLQTLAKEEESWPLEYVHLDVAEGVGVITIDRPEALNALNPKVVEELHDQFWAASHDPNVYVIVLRGSGGKSFVAGADLKFFIDNRTPERLDHIIAFTREGQELFHKIDISSKPVVAVVDGFALGGGLELALAADAIVAGPNALFRFPEVTQVGIYPGLGGTYRTRQKVGKAVAKWLILTGAPLKAQQAYEVGLVDVPPAESESWMAALKRRAARGRISTEEFHETFGRDMRKDDLRLPDFISAFEGELVREIGADLATRAKDSKDASRALTALQGGAPRARFLANLLIEQSRDVERNPAEEEVRRLDIFLTPDAEIGLKTPPGKPRVFTGAPASAADGGTHPFNPLTEAAQRIAALIPDEVKDLHTPSLIEIFEAIEHDPEATKTPERLALAKVLARNALRSVTPFSEDPYLSDLSPKTSVPSEKQKVVVLSASRLLDPRLTPDTLTDLLKKTEGSLIFLFDIGGWMGAQKEALTARYGVQLREEIGERSLLNLSTMHSIENAKFALFLVGKDALDSLKYRIRLDGSKTFVVSLKSEVDVAKEIQLGMRLVAESSLLNNVSTLDLTTQLLLAEVSENFGKLMGRHPTLETELKEAETVVTRIVKGL